MISRTKLIIIILIFILSGILGFVFSLYKHREQQNQLSQQIAEPVRETFHHPATFVKQLKDDPDAGRKIFNEFCAVCHGREPVINIKAPRIGDKTVWDGMRSLGIPTLLKLTVDGKGAMPARGGCFECSDEQLVEVIQYMLNES